MMLILYYTNHTDVKRDSLWEIQPLEHLLESPFSNKGHQKIVPSYWNYIPQVEDKTMKGIFIPDLILPAKRSLFLKLK